MDELDEAIEIEQDLNQYYTYYDLVYKDLDGIWKTVNAEIHLQGKVWRLSDIEDFLKKYRKGREDWNIKIVSFTVEVNAIPCK